MRQNKILLPVFLLSVGIFCAQPPHFSYAEINESDELSEMFDYSNLSGEERKQEANLIYKYAKQAYQENNIETAKTLFYQVLVLCPDHIGANKYLEDIIPRKLGLNKQSKAEGLQIILNKKEEAEFDRLGKSIDDAKEKMDEMERERLTREALYKSYLTKLEKEKSDKEAKEKNKSEKEVKKKEKAEKQRQARIDKEKKIRETKELKRQKKEELKRQKKEDMAKEKAMAQNDKVLPFTSETLSQGDIQEVETKERYSEEMLVDKSEKKEETSWKMIGRELDILEKENKRIAAKKEKKLRKKEIKENKYKLKEQARLRKIAKVEQKRKDREDKASEVKEKAPKPVEKKKVKGKPIPKKAPVDTAREEKILKRHEQAIDAALQKKEDITKINFLYSEGVRCYRMKRYDLAKETFTKLLEINPDRKSVGRERV